MIDEEIGANYMNKNSLEENIKLGIKKESTIIDIKNIRGINENSEIIFNELKEKERLNLQSRRQSHLTFVLELGLGTTSAWSNFRNIIIKTKCSYWYSWYILDAMEK